MGGSKVVVVVENKVAMDIATVRAKKDFLDDVFSSADNTIDGLYFCDEGDQATLGLTMGGAATKR